MENNNVKPDDYFVIDFGGISDQDIKKGKMFDYIYHYISRNYPDLKHFFSGDKLYIKANPATEQILQQFINWLMNFMNVETATLALRRNNELERLENFIVDGVTPDRATYKAREALQKFKEHNPLLCKSIGDTIYNSNVTLKDIKIEQTKVEMIKGLNQRIHSSLDKQAYFPICLKGYNKQHGTSPQNVGNYIIDTWFNNAVIDGDNIYIPIPQDSASNDYKNIFQTNMNNLVQFCLGATNILVNNHIHSYTDKTEESIENFKLHNPFFTSCYGVSRNTDITTEVAREEVEKMQNLYVHQNNVHLEIGGEHGLMQDIWTGFVYGKNNSQNQSYTTNNNNQNFFNANSYNHNLASLAQFLSQDPDAITKILESNNVKGKYTRNDVVAMLSSLYLKNPEILVDVLNSLQTQQNYDNKRISESLLDVVANVFPVTLVSPFDEVVINYQENGNDKKISLPYSKTATSITRNMNFIQIPGDIAKIRYQVDDIIAKLEADSNTDVANDITELTNYIDANFRQCENIYQTPEGYTTAHERIQTLKSIISNLNTQGNGEQKLAFLQGLNVVLSDTQHTELKNDDKEDKIAYSPTQNNILNVIKKKSNLVKDEAGKTIDDLCFDYFNTQDDNVLRKITEKKQEMEEGIALDDEDFPTMVVCDEKTISHGNPPQNIILSTHGTEVNKDQNGKITIKEASYPGSYYSIKHNDTYIEFNQKIIGGDGSDPYNIKNSLYSNANINIENNKIHSLHFENDVHIKFDNTNGIFAILNGTSYHLPSDIDLLNCTNPQIIQTITGNISALPEYIKGDSNNKKIHSSINELNTALATEPKINATLIPENFRNEVLEKFNDPNAEIDRNTEEACKIAYWIASQVIDGKYINTNVIQQLKRSLSSIPRKNSTLDSIAPGNDDNLITEVIKFALKFPIYNNVSPINPKTVDQVLDNAKRNATGSNIINELPDQIPSVEESFNSINARHNRHNNTGNQNTLIVVGN